MSSSDTAVAAGKFLSEWQYVFWGTTIADVVFGFSVLQSFIYFTKHHNDSWAVIALVTLLLIIGLVSAFLTTESLVIHFVHNFGKPATLPLSTIPQKIDDLLTIATQFVSQTFFAFKIFQVRRSYLPVVLLILSLTIATSTLASIVGVSLAGVTGLTSTTVQALFIAGLSLTAVNDSIIALTLVMVLRGFNTDFCQTRNIVIRFTILAVQRGVLITLVVLLWLGFFIADPKSLYWKPYRLIAPGVHIISLIAFLNGQHYSLTHMAKYGHQKSTGSYRGEKAMFTIM